MSRMPDAASTAPDPAPVPVLRTARLVLRGWQQADREPFAALNGDPLVGEMLGGRLTREQSDAMIDRFTDRWRTEGYSLWAVEGAGDGVFLGTVGLSIPSFAPERTVEVGWRLAHHAWGRGYATEAARAAVRFAFETLGLAELVSYTAAINARSRRVMEKLGMARADPAAPFDFLHPRLAADHPLSPHVTYRLSRAAWEAAARPEASR
jgi:RimJ/RimL family protein N-acetyltransferase